MAFRRQHNEQGARGKGAAHVGSSPETGAALLRRPTSSSKSEANTDDGSRMLATCNAAKSHRRTATRKANGGTEIQWEYFN